MKWTKLRRASGLLEYVCEHGVGHPDHKSANEIALKFKEWEHGNCTKQEAIDAWGTHGCDGCCSRDDFPGKQKKMRKHKCIHCGKPIMDIDYICNKCFIMGIRGEI